MYEIAAGTEQGGGEMNRPPAFQFYPRDWLDFKVQRMPYEAQGIYFKLLCFMWNDSPDQCSLPDDDTAIARALGISLNAWRKNRRVIQQVGDPLLIESQGRLISERLRHEIEKQQHYRALQAAKGQRSAQQRFNHGSTTVQPRHQPEGNSSSSSSSSDEEENTNVFSCAEWLRLLNEIAGKNFRPGEEHYRHIRARIAKGYTLADAEKVIRAKVKQWQGTEQERYLRPMTLFGTKFDSYLNEKEPQENRGPSPVTETVAERNQRILWEREEREQGHAQEGGSVYGH